MAGVISSVKNPLTIIAMFAGLAEVSGAAVLPLLAEPNQKIYIWFLMIFPIFLVTLFFYTLHKKPESLYAPSDFEDEKNYMAIFGSKGISIAAPKGGLKSNDSGAGGNILHYHETEVQTSLNAENKICEPPLNNFEDEASLGSGSLEKRHSKLMEHLGSELKLLAFLYAENIYNITFDIEKTYMNNKLGVYQFDGAYFPPYSGSGLLGDMIFLEIKEFNRFKANEFLNTIEIVNETWNHIKNVRVLLVLLVDEHMTTDINALNAEIDTMRKAAKFSLEIVVVSKSELKMEKEKLIQS